MQMSSNVYSKDKSRPINQIEKSLSATLRAAKKKAESEAMKTFEGGIGDPGSVPIRNMAFQGSAPVSTINEDMTGNIAPSAAEMDAMGLLKGIGDQRKAITSAMYGEKQPGPVNVPFDKKQAWIAAGLGLLGALGNRSGSGVRQAGFGAMQNVLNTAEQRRQQKAAEIARKNALDFDAKMKQYQAQLANLSIDEQGILRTENQKTANANAAQEARLKQEELAIKRLAQEGLNQRAAASNEIKITPQFVRDYEGYKKINPNATEAEALRFATLKQQQTEAMIGQTNARTDLIKEQTKILPIKTENDFSLRQALMNQQGTQFEQKFNWQKQNDIANRFLDQQKIDNDAEAKAAQAAQAEAKYPSYGGMTRDQQISAAKAKVNSIVAELKKSGITGDGMLSKAAIAANPRLKKLMEDFVYWNEVTRKISVGERLSRDPWAPPGQTQLPGKNAPLLPPNLQGTNAPPFKGSAPPISGPIGKK